MSFWQDFQKLREQAPRLNLHNFRNRNCIYNNHLTTSKNCYLCVSGKDNEDCYYSVFLNNNRSCVDCRNIDHCELCYETIDSSACYQCNFCQQCRDSSFLEFCFNCQKCKNCFGCVDLKHREYCIFNQQYTPEAYAQKRQEILQYPWATIQHHFEELQKKSPRLYTFNVQTSKSVGDYLENCKLCYYSFDLKDCQEAYYSSFGGNNKQIVDTDWAASAQDCYNCVSLNRDVNMLSCFVCWDSENLRYCELCFNCQNCFGCVGLYNKRFHILNQPYSATEFYQKVKEIKVEMQAEGIYGEPLTSCYPYEDTVAQDFYPKNN